MTLTLFNDELELIYGIRLQKVWQNDLPDLKLLLVTVSRWEAYFLAVAAIPFQLKIESHINRSSNRNFSKVSHLIMWWLPINNLVMGIPNVLLGIPMTFKLKYFICHKTPAIPKATTMQELQNSRVRIQECITCEDKHLDNIIFETRKKNGSNYSFL